ncbi:MAG: hypothetical protein ACI9XC_001289 [Gammaproteobacteria bacterium]|jgi:hypothetical protein
MRVCFYINLICLSMILIIDTTKLVMADEHQASQQIVNQDSTISSGNISEDGVVTFSAEFLQRYQPNTALDMVNRIPGFTLDNGGNQRGFGGAAGNVLINDRRPSTKQDQPAAILGRISADLVERIELIRVKVRDIDLLGQTVVVNVILRDEAPAAVRWDAYIRYNFDYGTTPYGAISLSDRWGEVEYNVGVDYRNTQYGDPGVIQRFDPEGTLIEIRDDAHRAKGYDVNGYFNASTWMGKNFVQLNSRASNMPRNLLTTSTRISQLPGGETRQQIFDTTRDANILELGIDIERVLKSNLLGKTIFLYSRVGRDPSSSQQDFNPTGEQTRLQFEEEGSVRTELISRLELDWAALPKHAIQVDLEHALNIHDNNLIFTDDTGTGPVVIDVPGGNTRVEEVRWNVLAQDTWTLAKFDLEYGINFERSTISQTGDANQKRSFNYIKPRMVLTYSPTQGRQTRLRFEREVSQLNFDDFVTATVFEDNNVTVGNKDLRPDRTWVAEVSHERRYGDIGVIKLTAFHHWITDVLDLLPLTSTFETTGNIGNGRRWGVILETTVPLDRFGLSGAQIDFKVRGQDSIVIDPVTGRNRKLTALGGYTQDILFFDENDYAFAINYRQDFEATRVSWGWGLAERAQRPVFKADELDIFNDGYNLTGFIETTRWFGLKLSIEGVNLLNNIQTRDRTIFVAERDLSPVLLLERRDGNNGAGVFFRVSGSY